MSQLYRIKPLKWESVRSTGNWHQAKMMCGLSVMVFQLNNDKWYHTNLQARGGSNIGTFMTAESAMKAAEKAYIKQLQQVLEEVSL